MAINLSALSNITTKASALSGLILVTPQDVGIQPQNAPSWQRNTATPPPSILFNYEGENTAALTSDITDHAIENNTMVQDQIALKPIVITTQGFVGELNDIPPSVIRPLKTAADKLTIISGYTPQLSTTALLAYANAFQLYQAAQSVVNSAVSVWSAINGGSGPSVINGGGITQNPNQTKQQIYFQQFYGYWQNRTLFTIQTPWAIFQDMAIQSLRAIQNAETRMISDFEVTFKLIRFATTEVVSTDLYNTNNMQGRAFDQGSKAVNLGTSTLTPSATSFSSVTGG